MEFLVIGVVVALAAGAYLYSKRKSTAPSVSQASTNSTPPPPAGKATTTTVTPPAAAGSTGSLVGQPVPGGDVPDANGAIAIPAIASKFPPNSRFLTAAALPFVPRASAQSFCIAANCQNVKFLEGAFVNIPDFSNYKPRAAVANPPEAAAVGGAAFHLQGQWPGESTSTFIPNCIAISNDLTTMDEVVAYCAKLPVFGSVHTISPVSN